MLRTYIDDELGRKTATTMMADVGRRAAGPAGPPEHLAVPVAGRLVAALGRAMPHAATNGEHQRPVPVMDPGQAAEAVSGPWSISPSELNETRFAGIVVDCVLRPILKRRVL